MDLIRCMVTFRPKPNPNAGCAPANERCGLLQEERRYNPIGEEGGRGDAGLKDKRAPLRHRGKAGRKVFRLVLRDCIKLRLVTSALDGPRSGIERPFHH